MHHEIASIDDLLVMAIALHRINAETVHSVDTDRVAANGRIILRQALQWAGPWDDETRAALHRDMGDSEKNPTVDNLYMTLIGMCRTSGALIKGFGNLGTEELPPSWPWYTAFDLTEQGRQHAEALFLKHPQFRSANPSHD